MALAIVAIAVTGLMRLHLISLAAVDKADHVVQAISIAQDKIAELEAMASIPIGTQTGVVDRNRTSFQWQTEVSDLAMPHGQSTDWARVRRVTVTVRWDHGLGRRDVSLSTALCERRRS